MLCCPGKEAAMGIIVSAAADPLYRIPVWSIYCVLSNCCWPVLNLICLTVTSSPFSVSKGKGAVLLTFLQTFYPPSQLLIFNEPYSTTCFFHVDLLNKNISIGYNLRKPPLRIGYTSFSFFFLTKKTNKKNQGCE